MITVETDTKCGLFLLDCFMKQFFSVQKLCMHAISTWIYRINTGEYNNFIHSYKDRYKDSVSHFSLRKMLKACTVGKHWGLIYQPCVHRFVRKLHVSMHRT